MKNRKERALNALANGSESACAGEWGTVVAIEENRIVAHRVLDDLVSQGRLELVGQIYAQAFEFRDPTAGQTITTHQGMRELTHDIRTRTPDIAVIIEEEIAEGDAVVHRWTASGHDAGTGKFWTAPGISIYHFHEGRIVSEYVVLDRLGLTRQLGMATTPERPPPEEPRLGCTGAAVHWRFTVGHSKINAGMTQDLSM